jgi:hypothetical protein
LSQIIQRKAKFITRLLIKNMNNLNSWRTLMSKRRMKRTLLPKIREAQKEGDKQRPRTW